MALKSVEYYQIRIAKLKAKPVENANLIKKAQRGLRRALAAKENANG